MIWFIVALIAMGVIGFLSGKINIQKGGILETVKLLVFVVLVSVVLYSVFFCPNIKDISFLDCSFIRSISH